jgi:Cof subfamily protein (haloacid dehalogenase superfamily)
LTGQPKYELFAIDLDGTLLNSRHQLPERNRAALHAAHQAGRKIVLCTGRSYTETRPIIDDLGLDLNATVTVGGALLTDVATGTTLERTAIEPGVARDATKWFMSRGYDVLWLYDVAEVGYDACLVNAGQGHPAIARWIEVTPCRVRESAEPPVDGQAPLRINVVDDIKVLDRVAGEFQRTFDGRMTNNVIGVPTFGFTVLEAFDATVNKWRGIEKLCRRWDIDPRQTVAVGDDLNDVPMVRSAGLGVAVANARAPVADVADRVVASNDDCGVADLIEELLGNRE